MTDYEEYMKNPPHLVTEHFAKHLYWVFDGGEGKPIWERGGKQRVVSMAACIVDGHLIVGNRHFCPVMSLQLDLLGIRGGSKPSDQGFVDQFGVYMTREEAYIVAKAAGQLKYHEDGWEEVLYSESYL